MCPNVGATHWVALGHSCQRARSWLGQTIREAVPREWWAPRGGDKGEAVPRPHGSGQKLHVSQRRGDPLGRPRSFMPTRSFMAGTNNSRGMPRGGGRRGASPDKSSMGEAVPRPHGPKVHVSQRVGATHWVALRSFMPTRSFMAGTNNSRGMPRDGGRRGASPDEGEAVPRPHAVRPKAPCVPT